MVVFTHELSFLADLVKYAGEANVPVTERYIYRHATRPGRCTVTLPWKARDVKARVGDFQERLAQIIRDRNANDAAWYEKECKL